MTSGDERETRSRRTRRRGPRAEQGVLPAGPRAARAAREGGAGSVAPRGSRKPAAAQIAAELAHLRGVETKLLVARDRPPERALAVGDKAVHRDAHRVDQHGNRRLGADPD